MIQGLLYRVLLLSVITGQWLLGFGQGGDTVIAVGETRRIFDQGVGEPENWYINDHCFIQGGDGKWHMFGITGREKPHPWDETKFAHAVADSLMGIWRKLPYALTAVPEANETVLWAPHVVRQGDTYYLYYCAGNHDHAKYQMNLATSKDLYEWTRYPGNPLFVDGYDGRDPFIFHDERNNRWIMYYTATSKPEGGYHIVAARISEDLINWRAERYVVYKDTRAERGTWGGNTESPVVIQRGDWYYLFIGPGASYTTTKVYRSRDPFNWDDDDEVATLVAHAAEVIEADGNWYISHCGWQQGGLYLAPLHWQLGESP